MRIACILDEGFEDSEFRIPVDRLRAAGHEVEVIGKKKGAAIEGKLEKEKVKVEREIGDADPDDYMALLIPGGYSPDHLRIDERFAEFVRRFDEEGKLIAAVCHGPQLLITADLVRGRTMTAWPTIQVDLKRAGAHVVDEEVTIDGNLITSRKPDDLEAFSRAIIAALGAGEELRV
jgi:deglycase